MHPARLRILQAIAQLSLTSPPPSLREIGELAGVTSGGHIGYHLDILRKEGLVTWETGKSRTIRLTEAGWEIVKEGQEP